MRAVGIILLVAFSATADEPRRSAIEVLDGTVRTPSLELVDVHGGAYMDQRTLFSIAQELAGLRAENRVLKETPVATPQIVLIALAVGIGIGLGVTFYIRGR